MPSAPLLPEANERPVLFAERAGSFYVGQVTAQHRKGHGMYLTPAAVAGFMADMLEARGGVVRLLDPAAGAGILLCAAVERLLVPRERPRRIEVTAYEVDADLARQLAAVLSHLAAWARGHGAEVTARVVAGDFVMDHAAALRQEDPSFDVIIANPPYFKIKRSDPRAVAASAVVHGQPNIYGLFMAVGAAMLRPGGSMVCITPRSFASGPYFRAFREWFFARIRPTRIHVFGSRRDAFRRDEVLQENVILHGERQAGQGPGQEGRRVTISTSQGAADILNAATRQVPLGDVLRQDRVLRLAATEDDASLIEQVASWPGSLQRYGLAVSTGPVVPFRAAEMIEAEGIVPGTHVPLLWMNHVTPMQVTWPIDKKREYIRDAAADRGLLVPSRSYVLLRRFSAKEERRRLVAAPYLGGRLDCSLLGLENHLNYIHRPGGELTAEEAWGLAALYNSSLLDRYFRSTSGNTQVNATELRAMPLPAWAAIATIGRRAAQVEGDLEAIDALVDEVIGK